MSEAARKPRAVTALLVVAFLGLGGTLIWLQGRTETRLAAPQSSGQETPSAQARREHRGEVLSPRPRRPRTGHTAFIPPDAGGLTPEEAMSASNAALSKLSPEAFSDWCEDLFESQEIDPAWAAFGESKLKPLVLRDMPKGGRLIDFECRQNLCRVEAWVPEPKEVTGNILASDGPMMDRGGGTVLVIRRIDEDGGLRTIHLIGDGDVIISPM